MFLFLINFFNSWNMLSWKKAHSNIHRLQKRILKSVLVGDIKKCLQIQKLLISSNSACLLSIKFIFQNDINSILSVNNKISLSFLEKFELVKFLQKNAANWSPQQMKKLSFIKK